MTACKDSLSGKKAVSATLAGVLAVGMVPAAAFAETAQADTTTADGESTMLQWNESAAEAFSNGTANEVATYSNNKYVAAYSTALTATAGVSQIVVPTTISVPSVTTPVTIATRNTTAGTALAINPDYKVSVYKADTDGKTPTGEALSEVINPGKYVTVVEAVDGDYKGGKVNVPYEIKAADLGTLSVYEVNPDKETDISDTSIVFNGSDLDLGIAAQPTNGVKAALKEGKDYSVKWFKAATNEETTVKNAGTYYAEVTGLGIYAGESAVTGSFEVQKFDLVRATVEADDVIASNTVPTTPTRVVNDDTTLDPSLVTITLQKGQVFKDAGAYTFDVSAADEDNIISDNNGDTKHITVNKIAKAATFQYDEDAWVSSFTTDLSAKKPTYFDASKVAVYNGKAETGTKLDQGDTAGKYKITVYNAKGQEVKNPFKDGKLTVPGNYTVKVSVITGQGNYAIGGSATATVKVTKGAIDADATAWVAYDGKVVEGNELDKVYDPTTGYAVNKFTYGVKDAAGKDVSSSDYTVKITDQDGKEYTTADTIKNAGTYTITITSTAYDITNATAAVFTVSPLDLTDLTLSTFKTFGSFKYVPAVNGSTTIEYKLGATTDLGVQYNTFKDANKDGKDDYKAVPSTSEIKLALQQYDEKAGIWKTVTSVKGESNCKVVVSALNSDVAKNYVFAGDEGTELDFQIVDQNKLNFYDVLPTEGSWYFDVVDKAYDKQLINGYNGAKLFGPNDSITRGQVACVLFNLAGGDSAFTDQDNMYNELVGWKSFDDVNGKEYYGEAIAWAKQAGVVSGYADGTFKADQNVTREEFACMLANYAKKFGNFTASDGSALAALPDAGQVSDYAKESVAWAVGQKIMGNGGVVNATAKITRAEAAAMVVNYAEL